MLDQRKFSLDASRWPIVVVTQHAAQLTDEERMASLEQTDRLLEERFGRYALILDNRRAEPPPATQRAMIADYNVRSAERVRLRCICSALVLSSDVMRATITAVQWKTGKPVNFEIFEDVPSAFAWVQQRVALDK